MRIPIVAGTVLLAVALTGCSPAPRMLRVPVVHETHGAPPELVAQAKKLRDAGKLLAVEEVEKQLNKPPCWLQLPPPKTRPLSGREVWDAARKAHIRVGYFFLCHKCNNWHLELAGGYAITANGAVATCYHVIKPKDMKEGYLIASDENGEVLPVVKILAANEFADVSIVRVRSPRPLSPLPLNTAVVPGDDVWCYSDPADRPGFFSSGIVNRYYRHWHGANSKEQFPLRMNVSTEWAPGSSGAAIVDHFGNAIGHVTAITPHTRAMRAESGSKSESKEDTPATPRTLLVFHEAVCASDVIGLVKRTSAEPTKGEAKP